MKPYETTKKRTQQKTTANNSSLRPDPGDNGNLARNQTLKNDGQPENDAGPQGTHPPKESGQAGARV